MDFTNILADALFFLTIGDVKSEMTKDEKLQCAWEKILLKVFEVTPSPPVEKTHNDSDNIAKLMNHIISLTSHYEQLLIQYFTDKEHTLDLEDETREMRKELHESGSLDVVELLFPFEKCDCTDVESLEVYSINGIGTSGIIKVHGGIPTVIRGGQNYKRTDIILGIYENNIYIFQAKTLVHCEMKIESTTLNGNAPLHTQVYRFFHNEFDMEGVRMTKQLIDEKGLDFVIKAYVRECFKLPQL